MRFIARLKPDQEIQDVLLRTLMAILTKQRFKLSDGKLVPEGVGYTIYSFLQYFQLILDFLTYIQREWSDMRKGTAGRIMLFTNGIYQLLDSS